MGFIANTFYCEDNRLTMERMNKSGFNVDIILTSPFYNSNKKAGKHLTLNSVKANASYYPHVRYDTHVDNMTSGEYRKYTVDLFNLFDGVLNANGCILYNLSYGANGADDLFNVVSAVITQTPFSVADVIGWKKATAIPNNCSKNHLTRIFEFIFVFCRKNEQATFNANKPIVSRRKTGQASYGNIYNFIDAKNNDGKCPFNKATFSSDIVLKLCEIYAKPDSIIYDPFMGSGTTAIGVERYGRGCKWVGSEISANQVDFSKHRLFEYRKSCIV